MMELMPAIFPTGAFNPEFAVAEFGKDVIHLQKDRFEKPDEQKETRAAGKTPTDQAGVETDRSFLPRLLGQRRQYRRMRVWLSPFLATPQKINCRKKQNFEGETDDEQLLMRGWCKAEKARMKIASA